MKTNDSETPIKPWYKQFWPWYLMSLPAAAVIAGIATVVIAVQNRDAMVVDNYYKQGLAINRTLEQQQAAAVLGLVATASVDMTTRLLTLTFDTAQPANQPSLQLSFIHATLPEQDHIITLTQAGPGIYRGTLQSLHTGNWNIILQPEDGVWRLDGRVSFPAERWTLKPEL